MEKTILTTDEQSTDGQFKLNLVIKYGIMLACIVLIGRLASILYEGKIDYDVTRQTTACPALLSISRSARDTLIIMKAEPLCNVYVLDNLK
jgi:hypothetical protein